MHELAICQSLLREVERVAAEKGAREVAEIRLAVGPLSGVEAPLLARAFELARAGGVAARAKLRIEMAPVIVWCESCQRETVVKPNRLLCGGCGDWRVKLRSGKELLLTRVELIEPVAG